MSYRNPVSKRRLGSSAPSLTTLPNCDSNILSVHRPPFLLTASNGWHVTSCNCHHRSNRFCESFVLNRLGIYIGLLRHLTA